MAAFVSSVALHPIAERIDYQKFVVDKLTDAGTETDIHYQLLKHTNARK